MTRTPTNGSVVLLSRGSVCMMFLLDIVVFRLEAFLLNIICLNLLFYTEFYKYRFSYKFHIVLYQFLKT